MLQSHKRRLLPSALLLGLMTASGAAFAQASYFTLTVNNAVSFTPFYPNGVSDITPPFTMCRGYQLGLRLKYTWRHPFAEQVSTEPIGTFYPYFFPQGMSPNPVQLRAAPVGNPIIELVDTGLISGPVNTFGIKTVTYRGRTLLNYDFATNTPRTPLTASVNVLIDNQFEPSSTQYREMADQSMDMPTRPWFGWTDDPGAGGAMPPYFNDHFRLDVDACEGGAGGGAGGSGLGCSDMEFSPYSTACSSANGTSISDYCFVGRDPFHQMPVSLLPDTDYEYRVLGRSTCGVSDELNASPVGRPTFHTAQACFLSNAPIPDGGVLNLDVSTLVANASTPNALAPNLRVTVHSNHERVGQLKISLSMLSPVAVPPVVLMDQPGAGACNGPRMQVAFGSNGPLVNGACRADEPTLRGTVSPISSLSTLEAAQGAGNWRLTVEDPIADGKAGSLLEWCLSSDIALKSAPFAPSEISDDGFE
jgi:subtilisin-like proprotein convertase family protein